MNWFFPCSETIRRARAGACIAPLGTAAQPAQSSHLAIAIAALRTSDPLVGAACATFIHAPSGAIREVIFHESNGCYYKLGLGDEIARVEMPHWDYIPPKFDFEWFKKAQAAARLAFRKPMPRTTRYTDGSPPPCNRDAATLLRMIEKAA